MINQQEHIICKDFSKDFLTALLVFVMRLDFFEFFIVIIMKTIIREWIYDAFLVCHAFGFSSMGHAFLGFTIIFGSFCTMIFNTFTSII